MDYHEDFKLYLVTRNPDPYLPPDVASLITIVNFTTTRSGLEGQLLGITIKNEKPELEAKKSQSLLQEEEQKVQMASLEKQLLTQLAASAGNVSRTFCENSNSFVLGNDSSFPKTNELEFSQNAYFILILENKALIDSLNETKQKSIVIAEALKEAQNLQASLDKEREVFRKIASNGSALYFLIMDLVKINNMYQFSLPVFIKLFQRALKKPEKSDPISVDQRINQVCDKLQKLVLEYVSRSLFKADRLMFALHLVHTMYPKLFGDSEWDLFVGKIVLSGEKNVDMPSWGATQRRQAFALLQNTVPQVVQVNNLP